MENDKEIDEKIDQFIFNCGLPLKSWYEYKAIMEEHQKTCNKDICHLCWKFE